MSAVAARSPAHVGGLSDDELVSLARGGYEPAFEAIVQRYRAPLVGYCRRWLDIHRAEEVVQHTLMKAFLCLRDDDRPLTLRPWLYRVAHNAALNAVEKKGGDWEQLDENYDGVPQPPQIAERRAHFLRVVDEIEALPARQRDALLLNEFEGRCYADIAAALGTSESGVRGLLRRARRQLREAAAVVLPLPALRELVRSDASRIQVDRAGDVVTSAGAVGGASAVGGVAKVAAGVLAAGTIAGGGAAIEQQRDIWRAPSSHETAQAEDPASVASRGLVPALGTGATETRDATAPVPLPLGANFVPTVLMTPGAGHGTLARDDEADGGDSEETPDTQGAGLTPLDPDAPLLETPQEESPDGASTTDPQTAPDSGSTAPSQPDSSGADQTAPSSGTDSGGGSQAATPASPTAPPLPQSGN